MTNIFVYILYLGSVVALSEAENSDNNTGATIIAQPSDPNKDADMLIQLFGQKNNYYQIMDLLTNRTNAQRQEIRNAYDAKNNKEVLMNKIYNYFKKMGDHNNDIAKNMKEILRTRGEFLARRIDHSLGLFKEDSAYISIICTSSNEDLKEISNMFPRIFGMQISQRIHKALKRTYPEVDDFLRYVVNISKPRSTSEPDDAVTKKLIKDIPDENQNILCDQTPLYEMMAKQSYKQIKAAIDGYQSVRKTKVTGLERICNCPFTFGRVLCHTAKFALYDNGYFVREMAGWFHNDPAPGSIDSMSSAGTQDVIWRSEIDLAFIRDNYQKINKGSPDLIGEFEEKLKKREGTRYLMKKMIDGNRG